MELLKKIESFIFESSARKLILVVFAIMFFKTGVWCIPNLGSSQAIAQNPFVTPFSDPNAHYLFWNWLAVFLAWVVGAKSTVAFFMFHFAFSIAFSLLFIKVVFTRFSDQLARKSLVLFSILPVSATAYFWVSNDSVTLFIMLFSLAYPRYSVVTFLVGIALGMQHFEQGFFATGGLLFAVLLSKKYDAQVSYSVKFCLLIFLGVIIGKVVLIGVFKYYAIEVNAGRMYWLKEHIGMILKTFIFHFHYIIWSILGPGWLVALRYTDWGRKTIPFFLTLFSLMLLLPISADQTRVLAIITFLLVAVFWLLNEDFLKKISNKEISLIFLIWAIMPWGWVWEGEPKWSVSPYDITMLFHWLYGWFTIPLPPEFFQWPFRSTNFGVVLNGFKI
jgi:hypothetical protein